MATKERQMPARDSEGRFMSKGSEGHSGQRMPERNAEGRFVSENERGDKRAPRRVLRPVLPPGMKSAKAH